MAYCTVKRVRKLSELDSQDVTDEDLRDIRDDVATPKLNDDVQVTVREEKVNDIVNSDFKENTIDGSNKTFYLQKMHESSWRLGDLNDDAAVDGNDVDAYYVDNDTLTDNLSVTVKDREIGKVEITESNGDAIPNTANLRIRKYAAAPVDMNSPDRRIETACAQLTAAFAFRRMEAGEFEDFSVGNITVNNRSEAFQDHMQSYQKTVRKLSQEELIRSAPNVKSATGVFHG